MTGWSTIEELCGRHLGGRPSPWALAQMKKVEGERREVRDLVARMFSLMEVSRLDPRDISPVQAWAVGTVIPGFLPDAWGGSIPPFTSEHRHKRIDAYLKENPWANFGAGTVLLEMGCGFPPETACDVARLNPDWQIIGADPCFDEFLLYDERGSYACLDADGVIRYFHPPSGSIGSFRTLYEDKPATLHHFSHLFQTLLPKLPSASVGELSSVEEGGARLIRHPMRLYEAKNLTFVQAGIGAEIAPVDMLRCFNVLGYFNVQFRQQAEAWASQVILHGGLFICGNDSTHTTEARYTVYRNEEGRLAAKEFAFSIDNLRNFTVAPWFSMHKETQETSARATLVGILRTDAEFRSEFDRFYDALLAEKRLFVRDGSGFLAAAPDQLPHNEWIDAQEQILFSLQREGFAERAANVLRRGGMRAWVNKIGDVAIDPATLPT